VCIDARCTQSNERFTDTIYTKTDAKRPFHNQLAAPGNSKQYSMLRKIRDNAEGEV